MAENRGRWTGFVPYAPEPTGALGLGAHDMPFYEGCPMSSAAEGNRPLPGWVNASAIPARDNT